MAMNLSDGGILWISEIQKYKKPKKRKGLLTWSGPLMAGGRLLLAGTNGLMLEYNPKDGSKLGEWNVKETIHIAPIIADGTLYILAEDGSLLAYR